MLDKVYKSISVLIFGLLCCSYASYAQYDKAPIQIFPNGEHLGIIHAAFTDLVYFKNTYYCVFRVGEKHVGDNGKIYLMSSKNKSVWKIRKVFQVDGVDLRDPKFLLDKVNNILNLHIGGSVFKEKKGIEFNAFKTSTKNGRHLG